MQLIPKAEMVKNRKLPHILRSHWPYFAAVKKKIFLADFRNSIRLISEYKKGFHLTFLELMKNSHKDE